MKRFYSVIISICVILGTLLAFIDFMSLDISYYNNFHRDNQIAQQADLSMEWVDNASKSIVDFLDSGEESILQKYFNNREVSHMRDVYYLFKLNRTVYMSLIILSIVVVGYYIIKKDNIFFNYLKKYFLKIYFLIIGFFAVCTIFFSSSFIYFHEIFFDNDLWILDYEKDLMIRILPENFFFTLFINILTLTTIVIFLIYFVISFKKNSFIRR